MAEKNNCISYQLDFLACSTVAGLSRSERKDQKITSIEKEKEYSGVDHIVINSPK